ncbi:MAG: cyclophilin-like fold protein [Cetobacterium sp.]|uniref:cyclophilin-like fold protein n=1 Tax=Cetobacterium sp. TaxID=2071632 RepID=UPI003EE45AAC
MRKIVVLFEIVVLFIIAFGSENSAEKIKFSFEGKSVIVIVTKNSASKDLIKQLPLELKFENYGDIEKISYLSNKLDISNSPRSYTPKTYDLTYYSPWRNLAFFTKEFRASNGLVPLGKIESGFENLEFIDKALKVMIEKIE